jgi:hypothetical protein
MLFRRNEFDGVRLPFAEAAPKLQNRSWRSENLSSIELLKYELHYEPRHRETKNGKYKGCSN